MSTTNHDFIGDLQAIKAKYDAKYLPQIQTLKEQLEALDTEYRAKLRSLEMISNDLSDGNYTFSFGSVDLVPPVAKGGIAKMVLSSIQVEAKHAIEIAKETNLEMAQVRSSITALKRNGKLVSVESGRKRKYIAVPDKTANSGESNAMKLRNAILAYIEKHGTSSATDVRNGVIDLSVTLSGNMNAAKSSVRQSMF